MKKTGGNLRALEVNEPLFFMVQESIKHFPNTTSENRLKLSLKLIFLYLNENSRPDLRFKVGLRV